MTKTRSLLFDSMVISSWWVILFLLLLFFIYDQAMQRRKQEEAALKNKYEQLLAQKNTFLQELEDLTIRKNSQGEKAWIEMVLKEKLGLVEENQIKVIFQ